MSRTTHMCIDLRGALMNWEDRMWRKCVTADDGHTMTPQEVKMQFLDELATIRFISTIGARSRNVIHYLSTTNHQDTR